MLYNYIMNERIVFTDAASSLTEYDAQNLGIGIIPFRITFGSKEFTDFDISSSEFYSMVNSKEPPKTSAPNPGDFIKRYKLLYEKGVREIASVHLGSVNSRTYESAFSASESEELKQKYPDLKIIAIDSNAVSLALLHKVEIAQKMLIDGFSLKDIKIKIEDKNLNKNIVLFGAGGRYSFNNLRKSGRVIGVVDKIKARAASIMGLIPIIRMNLEGGVELYKKDRGEKKCRGIIFDDFMEEIKTRGQPKEISIAYTKNEKNGQEVEEKIIKAVNPEKVKINKSRETGTGLGCHFGGGATIIAGFWE
jgi:DegV family protein with EDD domain